MMVMMRDLRIKVVESSALENGFVLLLQLCKIQYSQTKPLI